MNSATHVVVDDVVDDDGASSPRVAKMFGVSWIPCWRSSSSSSSSSRTRERKGKAALVARLNARTESALTLFRRLVRYVTMRECMQLDVGFYSTAAYAALCDALFGAAAAEHFPLLVHSRDDVTRLLGAALRSLHTSLDAQQCHDAARRRLSVCVNVSGEHAWLDVTPPRLCADARAVFCYKFECFDVGDDNAEAAQRVALCKSRYSGHASADVERLLSPLDDSLAGDLCEIANLIIDDLVARGAAEIATRARVKRFATAAAAEARRRSPNEPCVVS